ncbi:MAG: HlyD family efflux transporter periplasmic adaptor subunit [Defluviitaleaceae bacterium]|nr:HlyD family efflux transporter periplasmic adaptor subunit [Defluviitaleaceae bacterium]
MKKNKKIIITSVIVIGIGISVYAFAMAGANTEPRPVDIHVTTVSRQTLETTVTAQGEVYLLPGEVAFINNTLEVSEVLVLENDVVEAGQPLMTFNTHMQDRTRQLETLEHQLNDTNLTLRSQEVTLDSLRIGPTVLEIENANLNITRAEQGVFDAEFALEELEANIINQETNIEVQKRSVEIQERLISQIEYNLEDARTTLSNTRILFQAGATTQVNLDNAARAVDNIENELLNAHTNLVNINTQISNLIAQLDTTIARRGQIQQNINSANENLRISQIQLEDLQNRINSPQNLNQIAQQEISIERTRLAIQDINRNISNLNDVEEVLLAPVSGTVTNINVVSGGMATQGQALVQINDPSHYVIRAFVNERHAGLLNIGQDVLIEGSILGNNFLTGNINTISTIATTTSISGVNERVVPIEISINDVDTSLLIPGIALDVTITTDVRENALTIPFLSTSFTPDGGTYVFVVNNDNILEQRFIEIITQSGMDIEVSGVNEGEIIVSQTQNANNGMLVNPIW